MLKIKAIIKDNTASPDFIPELFYGSLFDGEYFIFFDSNEERINYLATL